jgi:glycerol-3-phosphate dehydrogenase
MSQFDLAVVGGGINGVGIARDAAGRGLRVLLVEQHDLASGTSSASTKLIHGGLRYLEHGWFRLVREALIERELMLRMAPHLTRPIRFVLPLEPGMRPRWMLRLGLFIYDHLGGRLILPPSHAIDLRHDSLGAPLKQTYVHGFEYSDCATDDARLVMLSAVDAAERGAMIRTRMRCIGTERGSVWRLRLEASGRREIAVARVLVNATGPWLPQFAASALHGKEPLPVRLDKGSHIVVRRLFEHDRAYVFQNSDGRVVFAIPFEDDFTLIGTTDQRFAGDPTGITASGDEIAYLCNLASSRFRQSILASDVVWSFAGIRALHDDGSRKSQDVSRDYFLDLDAVEGKAPLLTVYGGKITTYRRLAEHCLDRLQPFLPTAPAWTAHSHLPGGEFPYDGFEALVGMTHRAQPFLSEREVRRLVRAYGTRVERVLGSARARQDLGPMLGPDLSGAEVRYLIEREWAQTADDVLWRRSKLGLRFSPEETKRLAQFIAGVRRQ